MKDQKSEYKAHRSRDYMLRVALTYVAGGIALHGVLSLGRSREGIFVTKITTLRLLIPPAAQTSVTFACMRPGEVVNHTW